MKKLLMGIDVGTTHIKAAVFDIKGHQETLSIKENRLHTDADNYSYYDPFDIKATVYAAVSDAIMQIDGTFEIMAVAVTGMAESGVPIDKCGNPLYHIITWFDQRTAPQAERLKETLSSYDIYKECGLIIQPKYTLNKLMWIRENEAEVYSNMTHWLCMEDYIIYSLSGAIATDYSIANRTMAMNVLNGQWSDKMLYIAGIDREILSPIYKSGTVVGKVTKEAASITHLKEGTPVVTGGHDHLCAAFALGVINDGDVFDSMGTAETIVTIKDSVDIDEKKFNCGFSVGRYVDGSKFYILGGIQNSGGSIEWFLRNFIETSKPGMSKYDVMDELSKVMEGGPSKIFYIPHLRGSGAPNIDPSARGAFIGLRSEHTKADMLKALYEGVSFELRVMKDSLEKVTASKINSLKIGGGAAKNHYWMKVKADALNVSLDIPSIDESAALGAALLGGIGAGVYKDAKEANKSLDIAHRIIKPDMKFSSQYDYLYNNGYINLYNILKSTNEVLSKL